MTIQASLAVTAFFMGIAGGPHCIAMCGPACAAVSWPNRKSGNTSTCSREQVLHLRSQTLLFHSGRLIGYASLGAVAAASIGKLAWFSSNTQALQPLWTFFHIAVLAWGMALVLTARQPVWVDRYSRALWATVRKSTSSTTGTLLSGMAWAFMPCGLLYSALMVAALNANALGGATSMAAFALGTSVSLITVPWLWRIINNNNLRLGAANSMRLAGVLLCLAATWAIWMDMVHGIKVWCN